MSLITKKDFDALRATQAELLALQDQEGERAKQLTEAKDKVERLQNVIAQTLDNPRGTWESIDSMQRELAIAQLTVTSLEESSDDSRTARIEELHRATMSDVATFAGKPDPFADEGPAETVTSTVVTKEVSA